MSHEPIASQLRAYIAPGLTRHHHCCSSPLEPNWSRLVFGFVLYMLCILPLEEECCWMVSALILIFCNPNPIHMPNTLSFGILGPF